jgi:predicted exporter
MPRRAATHIPEAVMLLIYCAVSFAAGVAATFLGLLGLVLVVGDIDERPSKLLRQ